MVVDEAVSAAIRGQSQARVATFVASCAERAAQVFTGLSGDDPARNGDVDVIVRLVEDLWNPAISTATFQDYVTSLDGFQELGPSDEEIVDVVGIYTFYSVLVLRYAALYRSSADVEDALRCAHVSLTAMRQLDQNLQGVDFFAQEAELQRYTSSLGDRDAVSIQRLRETDRTVSRERLVAIQGRLTR
ncbi:hypothetical protein GTU99_16205 [Streptomyces sp. PRKS01-65]|nr:hypothetical protein [Streptomyces harenosi]NEY33724.1 hypothetical protein [Streptomyces harenosi]